MIGEYDADVIREYVYLGSMPIGLLSNEKDGEVLQVHTDHLGTPRAVSDKDKSVLWRMEGDQFGDVAPQISTITMPLRHAGQYFDGESGLFYNYFRFYDPKSGRKERYKRRVDESSLNKSSMEKCYAGLRGSGASHRGYGVKWQDSWIEDHPYFRLKTF